MAKKTNNRVAPARRDVGKTQRFIFHAPGALSVMLVGDFTRWQQAPISLRQQPDGLWHADVELVPGQHHYRFLVDGEWRDDPECSVHVANAFGSQDCVCEVR